MTREIAYDGFFKVEVVETAHRKCEIIKATNSVSILLYFPADDSILLIKQSRLSMISEENPNGAIIESVSGRFDIDLSPKDLMIKEAEEEAGVFLKAEDIMMLNNGEPMSVSAGMTNELCYLGYAEIYPDMFCVSDEIFGLAEEGEYIERVWLDRKKFINQPVTCLRVFAFQQWLKNHFKN